MTSPTAFPATAATSLVEGYCADFVSLSAVFAQTLEQIKMRGLPFDKSRPALERTMHGMRQLSEGIHALLQEGGAAPAARPAHAPSAAPAAHAAPVPPAASARAPARAGSQAKAPLRRLDSPPRTQQGQSLSPAKAQSSADGAPANAANALRGNTKSMPLRTVFQFLGRMRKNGVLTVRIENETLRFDFLQGCIVMTSTDAQVVGERLGDLIVEMGFATPNQLRAPGGKQKLGDELLRAGVVSHGQLVEALERQVKRRFARAVAAPDAEYAFAEAERSAGDGRMRIEPFELLHESKLPG